MTPQMILQKTIALRVASIELCNNTLTSVLSVSSEGTSLVSTAGVSEAIS
jgi:hypothetical protein